MSIILDAHVSSRRVSRLYREHDEIEMIEAAKNEPAWRDIAKHMVHAWNEGMETVRSPKAAPHFRGLESAIEDAGLSGPRKPEHSREVIGRSELLAKKR